MPTRWPVLTLTWLAFALRVWAIDYGLPYVAAFTSDAERFVSDAALMAANGTLHPPWFGHPGSTLIYPLELLFLATGPGSAAVGSAFAADPTPFYVLGRFLAAGAGTLLVPLTYLLGRRLGGGSAGVLGALLLTVSPTHYYYSGLARPDVVAVLFVTLAVWGCFQLSRGAGWRTWLLTGAAVGLAASSKYPAGIVAVCLPAARLAGAGITWHSRPRLGPRLTGLRAAILSRQLVVALLLAAVVFAATSPYVFLDPEAVGDILYEARTSHLSADGLSPAGNLWWYFSVAFPKALGPAALLLAVPGVWRSRRRGRELAILLLFVIFYLALIVNHPLHWPHWILPTLPVVAALAGAGAMEVVDRLGRGRARRAQLGIAVVAAVLLAAPLLATVVRDLAWRGLPDTRLAAKEWIEANLPSGTSLAIEDYGPPVDEKRFMVKHVFSLSDSALADYNQEGVRYLISSTAVSNRYLAESSRYPDEVRFYEELPRRTRLVRRFSPLPGRRAGPTITLYRLRAGR